ncbi:CRISPR-associated endonuclease Cas2 [Colwellia sp. 12G3]|uniref:CRISPR-associated endonuclease Cas2 n=1 Tax=Colwellia sp. 12G3 TaxID=2058299 RepID=UPI000C341508|nr:CRISPR-associated endonuclease Cas2 [Colwellia sp. 12G3]PKI12722.1 CRISPR-associated endonuclease Cas2 [Colwellia sp. 12G3]
MSKKLYVCCYDISCSKRRNKVFKTLKKHQIGGQYSAYECYLTAEQKIQLEQHLLSVIDENDTIKLQVINNVENIICLGIAHMPVNTNYLYFG